MKTVVINGSPRKKGATAALAGRLLALLPGDSAVIETYYAHISPCIDCGYCREHDTCAVADGMQTAYGLLTEADNIVIASPIYFGEMTGSLLQFASRLQLVWSAAQRGVPLLGKKARRGAVILTAGSNGPFEAALSTSGILLRTMGASFAGRVLAAGTDRADAGREERLVGEIRRLAQRLKAPADGN
jgi:multimeric flavodoxin WrbA